MNPPMIAPSEKLAPRKQVAAVQTPRTSELTVLAVGVVVVAGLYLGREVLVPITLAVLLSFVLSPLVDLLRRAWLGRVPSILLAVFLALGVILSMGGLIGTQIAELAGDIPLYRTTIQSKIGAVRNMTLDHLSDMMHRVGKEMGANAPVQPDASLRREAPPPALAPGATRAVPVEIQPASATPFELAQRFLSPIVSPLSSMGIIFIVAIFVLAQKEDLRDRMIRLFGSTDLHRTTAAMDDAARRLSRYFLTQLAINSVFGVVIGVGLLFIRVPSPLLWGILAALLRFVPYIGSPIAALLPVALAAAVSPGWAMMIEAATLFLVCEILVSQVFEPMLYSHSTGLSPVAVVVAAIFWAWLWGSIGLILSTPLTVCLVVLGRHIKRLEFLDVLLGDSPALTPVESFYQRMLAGDPDEAQDYAEALLRDVSLSTYYDEVALAGLRLAANDLLRGALTETHVDRISHAIETLVLELADHDDAPPEERHGRDHGRREERLPAPVLPGAHQAAPPAGDRAPNWRAEQPVLCLGGRGPLDEAASAMLAQLLGKHGLGARVLPHEAASRANIGAIDPAGIAMVCVSYLEIAGSPSHLRYLLRRLRQQMPQARLMVGLWPAGDRILHDAELGRAVGADTYVTSLREAVASCLDACWSDSIRDAVTLQG